jgi:hypothetical protein
MQEINKLIGLSIKLQTKEEPQPFYFKVTGCARDGSSIVGYDDQGQNMLIKSDDILEVIMK